MNAKIITHSFQLTKNLPLDSRFKINNINEIDEKIPNKLRYEGLIFSAGNNENENSEYDFYTFVYDKTSNKFLPILFIEYLNRHVKLSIEIDKENYNNLNNILNETCYPKTGTTVYVKPLDIIVQWTGEFWRTIYGEIHVTDESEFDLLENNFKNKGWICLVNDVKKYILDDLTLSDPLLIFNSNTDILNEEFWNNNKEFNRFFLIDQTLYYNFNGVLYSVNDQIYIKKIENNFDNFIETEIQKTAKSKSYIIWDCNLKSSQNILASTNPNILNFDTQEKLNLCVEIECYCEKLNNGNYRYYFDIPENCINNSYLFVMIPEIKISELKKNVNDLLL